MNLTKEHLWRKPEQTESDILTFNKTQKELDKIKIVNCYNKLDLAKAVFKYYNTIEKVAIKYNRKFVFIGHIKIQPQTFGTFKQQQTYLQIEINKFTNELLTKN